MAESYTQDMMDTDSTQLSDGELSYPPQFIQESEEKQLLTAWADMPNIADQIKSEELNRIGELVCREFEVDKNSRDSWEDSAKKAMETVEAKKEAKSYPFQGASNVKYPMLITATLQFAARAYPAIVQGPKMVKCPVQGKDPQGQKKARGERVSSFMSHQLLKQMPEWADDTDWLLHTLPVVGCAFRKTYWSYEKNRPCSEMVSAFDFVVNNKTRTLEDCPRATHIIPPLYPHEIEERRRSGTFLDIDLEESDEENPEDSLSPHDFLEQHRRYDLDGDGYAEPLIITVHKKSQKVVRIVANYDPDEITENEGRISRIPANSYFTKYSFIPDPNGGFYDIGYGKLLENITDVVDSTLNQMMDAGHLQNAGGGFIGSGLRMKTTQLRQEPGLYHTLQASGGDIRSAIVHHQHPGPSATLFQLLGMIVEAGKEVASISEVITGDVQRNQTATTTLALIEQGLKVFTAIYKRIFRSLSREFQLLYKLNNQHLDEQYYINFVDEQVQGDEDQPAPPVNLIANDFNVDDLDICPVANPNEVTDMQKLGRAQVVVEVANDPIIDKKVAYTRYFEAAGIENHDELFVEQQGPSPIDQAQMMNLEADVEKKKSEALKNQAIAQKTEVEAARVGVETMMQGGEMVANSLEQGVMNENY